GRGRGEAAPQSLLPADGDDEVNPAVVRIKGEGAAGPLAIGQIEVLGVGAERVSAIAAARDGDRDAGADHDDRIVKGPTLSRETPASLELGSDGTGVRGGYWRVRGRASLPRSGRDGAGCERHPRRPMCGADSLASGGRSGEFSGAVIFRWSASVWSAITVSATGMFSRKR